MNKKSIKTIRLLFFSLFLLHHTCHAAVANWNIVSYLQADNSLAAYAEFNVREMQKANIPASVNVLVEWDKPHDNKTWRYQIQFKKLIDAGSFTGVSDLGTNPVQELIDMVTWAKALTQKKSNALRWCINLWNHGYGILDPRLRKLNKSSEDTPDHKQHLPWLMLPGLSYGRGNDRGILFDDSQNTYVTAAGLTRATTGMRNVIGKKIDLMCMDACLMAMIEVGYQVNGLVDILVASENTEPGNGFHYAGFLGDLSANPAMTTQQLATSIVQQYGRFYAGIDNSITLSAIKIDALVPLKNNINQLITAINACSVVDAGTTLSAVQTARSNAMSFEIPDYVDLLSLYSKLNQAFASSNRSPQKPRPTQKPKPSNISLARSAAINNVTAVISAGIPLIRAAVVAKTAGNTFKNACGLSIYYPQGPVDSSYSATQFSQDTQWSAFIARYQ